MSGGVSSPTERTPGPLPRARGSSLGGFACPPMAPYCCRLLPRTALPRARRRAVVTSAQPMFAPRSGRGPMVAVMWGGGYLRRYRPLLSNPSTPRFDNGVTIRWGGRRGHQLEGRVARRIAHDRFELRIKIEV